MIHLPITNSPAVTPAPSHTSRQRIGASGSSRKIMAKSSVWTAIEPTRSAAAPPQPRRPSAATAALSTSDTLRRKPVPRTAANERKRDRTFGQIPAWVEASTSQMRFSAAWSWVNALVEPKSSTARPMRVARGPRPWRLALLTRDWMAVAPSSPTRPRIWPTISPWAASEPKSAPATAITMTRTGAREKTV
jgi:hypothetical protein